MVAEHRPPPIYKCNCTEQAISPYQGKHANEQRQYIAGRLVVPLFPTITDTNSIRYICSHRHWKSIAVHNPVTYRQLDDFGRKTFLSKSILVTTYRVLMERGHVVYLCEYMCVNA